VSYTVVWIREAEDELAALWLDAADRTLITDAVCEIDGDLAIDPIAVGESRQYMQRVAYHLPIGIRFEILPADRLVKVLAVWNCCPRNQ
jgi:hypothetical protein